MYKAHDTINETIKELESKGVDKDPVCSFLYFLRACVSYRATLNFQQDTSLRMMLSVTNADSPNLGNQELWQKHAMDIASWVNGAHLANQM